MKISEWKVHLEQEREERDRFFSSHYQLPIPPEECQQFKGLNHYPPDPDYRFEVKLHEYSERETLKIEDTSGKEREFFRWGEFRFKIGGKETYGAGRYLDLDPDEHYTGRGNGYSTLIRHITPAAHIVDSTPVPLCPQRIGSKCRCGPVRSAILRKKKYRRERWPTLFRKKRFAKQWQR